MTILIVLSVFAFFTRALPYSMSLLPFNNDGLTEARIANDILLAGHLTYPDGGFYVGSYSTVTMVFNVMIAYASSCVGVDTYTVSQSLTAALSVMTIVGVYAIALRISGNLNGSLVAAFVLALLGTFVFLTGSTWKGSLGVALLVLLTFAYINRFDRRYLAAELAVLAVLPLSYHLVTIMAFLMLAYLTSWSMLVAIHNRRISSSHVADMLVVGATSVIAYVYYSETSFERLSDYGTAENFSVLIIAFAALVSLTAMFLFRKKSMSLSLAPVAGTFVVTIVFLDYSRSVFPYSQGYEPTVYVLCLVYGFVVAFGWFGFELLSRSRSRYRAIPLGLLLPVLTLLLLALIAGFDMESHKMFYRTFDYADISLAIGASVAIAHFAKGKYRKMAVGALTVALLCSFPFGYATSTLLGDRHDTQQYEVDAIAWIRENADSTVGLRSDERLSYSARALFDFGKDPYLPSMLYSGTLSSPDVMNVLLEEWMVYGVNDYPRGHPVLDEDYVNLVIAYANVLYIGGPESDNLIVFQTSTVR